MPNLHLWYCIMQFGQMKFEVLLPNVAIEESVLYGIRQVQVLVPMRQHDAVVKMEICVLVFRFAMKYCWSEKKKSIVKYFWVWYFL